MDDLRQYISSIRRDFKNNPLDESTVPSNPLELFEQWFKEAIKGEVPESNAMSLATIQPDGFPSVRVVYLRDITAEGLTFYTNYDSDKGKAFENFPYAGVNFFWNELDRQVRIQGKVSKVSPEISDKYFASRPRESQIGAWSSVQSSVIESRNALEKLVQENTLRFEGMDVPRPPFWGGYLLTPEKVEFWQGRPSRLHDRILFTRNEAENWDCCRLSP